jgi:hypothetical protein
VAAGGAEREEKEKKLAAAKNAEEERLAAEAKLAIYVLPPYYFRHECAVREAAHVQG